MLATFLENDSRIPSSGFHLTVLRTHVGLATLLVRRCPPRAEVCTLPLLSLAQQSFLTPFRPSGPRSYSGGFGFSRHWMVSLCSHEHPRRVGPVPVSHSWDSAACSVCRLPLSLRLTVRRVCRYSERRWRRYCLRGTTQAEWIFFVSRFSSGFVSASYRRDARNLTVPLVHCVNSFTRLSIRLAL